jgi:hypothetical protein
MYLCYGVTSNVVYHALKGITRLVLTLDADLVALFNMRHEWEVCLGEINDAEALTDLLTCFIVRHNTIEDPILP